MRGASSSGFLLPVVALVLLLSAVTVALADRVPAQQPAETMPLAAQSLLLGASSYGDRVIAVGERGHILLSRDAGTTWHQAKVPTRATLTAVALVDREHAWAVGHDGVILASRDGGLTWVLQSVQTAQPLLDVLFVDDRHGVAAGGYGHVTITNHGGRHWQSGLIRPSEEAHVNALEQGPNGALYAAGEFGVLFRSEDRGRSWRALPSPYRSSLFGVLALSDLELLVFGLRGHLFRTSDGGASWSAIETGTQATLLAGVELPDRRVVIGGLEGVLLVSADRGRSVQLLELPDRQGIADLVALGGDEILLVGEGGLRRLRGLSKPVELTRPELVASP